MTRLQTRGWLQLIGNRVERRKKFLPRVLVFLLQKHGMVMKRGLTVGDKMSDSEQGAAGRRG